MYLISINTLTNINNALFITAENTPPVGTVKEYESAANDLVQQMA